MFIWSQMEIEIELNSPMNTVTKCSLKLDIILLIVKFTKNINEKLILTVWLRGWFWGVLLLMNLRKFCSWNCCILGGQCQFLFSCRISVQIKFYGTFFIKRIAICLLYVITLSMLLHIKTCGMLILTNILICFFF